MRMYMYCVVNVYVHVLRIVCIYVHVLRTECVCLCTAYCMRMYMYMYCGQNLQLAGEIHILSCPIVSA